ncbi:MAG: hypothetical protein ABS79_04760 [Planctomycetes bacterium SCN 63-9]|nr:MAG: hypothetical protein ABS79_04760 [Planctomycetes bacterium SCN 63-9]
MAPRSSTWTRHALALVLIVGGLAATTGCDPRTIMYFLQPFEPTVPAKGPSLKGKKVVILTRATSTAQGEFPSIDNELEREFTTLLRKNSKKVTFVEAEKVHTWVEGHPDWTDPAEAARDHEADVAIFLEMEEFRLSHPGDLNMLQGRSKIHIKAYELKTAKNSKGKEDPEKPKESEEIWNDYQETEFPTRGPVPVESAGGRDSFKNRFLKVVAAEASWHFVDHAEGDDIQDVRFNKP